MRKRILEPAWLNLERLARVELSSEEPAHHVEAVLICGDTRGWRAAHSGEQTIRPLFDEPLNLRHIRLVITKTEHERTQEFVLRWSRDGGQTYREIVRQQYHFSPPETTQEREDYGVELEDVGALEPHIVPDISRGSACATLELLRLA